MADKEDLKSLLAQTRIGKQLSEYHLKLLKKQKINTLHEFLDAQNLHKFLALSIDQVEQIKGELLLFSVKSIKFSSLYQKQPFSYSTGIEEFDKLLEAIGQPFRPGRIWEVYGESGVGKTQLLNTLAVNFVCQYRDYRQVLFLDTKRDFDSRRIHQMLQDRHLDTDAIKSCMRAINVIVCSSAESLIKALDNMIEQISSGDDSIAHIKLVLIDSLAASFIFFRSAHERNMGRRWLNQLAMLMRTLAAQHGIAFVIGNLSMTSEDGAVDDDDDNEDYLTQYSPEAPEDGNLLGDYWDSVCTLSMTFELPDESNNDLRLLRILSNSFGISEGSCLLRITDAGVI
ncbi:uncharacterized protein LOC133845425 isoform X1 [Drosophila sulfurigaster albostrigata]|uniref:uncharacterized protein LOC133845425 isoform X1 n=1 Tax=Drosophila sulfurigaster albostrigata TaxID=89887 RepID=UPI002D21BF47|nr:uncharacterized protein LOC133845425 isoform X1 [Drosophila sulfurigaster albostrigata]